MKKNILVQVDEKSEIIHHEATYDEEGNIITKDYDEEKKIPIMGMIYRDMTEEEIAEMQKQQEQLPPEEPTQLDRIEAQAMYTALMTDTLI